MVAKSKKNGSPKQTAGKSAAVAEPEAAVVLAPKPVTPEAATPEPATPEPAIRKPTAVAADALAPIPMKPKAVKAPAGAAPAKAFFGYPDLPGFGRDDLAALVRANAALVKGFEELGQEVAGLAQDNMTQAVGAAHALVGVRTVADLVAINRNLAQATLDSVIAKSARLSEIGIRVASEAFGPLNEQVATVLGRLGRPAG